MLEQLFVALKENGYLILFVLVFIQELGVPTVSNELILIYFGYLCSQSFYSIALAIFIGISADVLGSLVLFSLFYFFSDYLSNSKIKFIKRFLEKVKTKQEQKNFSNKYSFFFGRLIPFIRGYVSVFAGVSRFSYSIYFLYLFISAIIFTGGFIGIGFILGNQFENSLINIKGMVEYSKYFILISVFIFFVYLLFKNILFKKELHN